MKRRLFTKMMAVGAGSIPLFSFGAQKQGPSSNDVSADDVAGDDASPPEPEVARPPSVHWGKPVTVHDLVPLAKAILPKATFDYITTGSEDELTLRDNVAAFRRIKVLPPLLHGVSSVDLSTRVLGQRISMPILLAPVAAQRMYHPEGALAGARAAAKMGTIFGTSTSAGNSVEEIAAAADGPLWFQLYVPKDRSVARKLVRRVERAGYRALVVTVDLGERKDADRRNEFRLPKEMLLKHLRDVGHEQLTDRSTYDELVAFNEQAWDLSFTWEFFDWLRSITKLPLLVKGVLSKQDALKAVSLGLEGIIVSNHGGRRLDGMPATIDVLPGIAEAVAGRTEIFLDSGIRRGTDVLKALALGARAVLIGRPYAWGLAYDGEAGVRLVLEMFRDELRNAMIATGSENVKKINRSLLMPRA